MASGLPDYYRGVDIAYQALSQMIVRPKYGGATHKTDGIVVDASEKTILKWVTGKGMIYGGIIFLDHTASQKTGIIDFKVDGNLISSMNFESMEKYGVNVPQSYPIYLLKYDDTAFVYCVALSNGITFEENILLEYTESEGETPMVFFDIVYALI